MRAIGKIKTQALGKNMQMNERLGGRRKQKQHKQICVQAVEDIAAHTIFYCRNLSCSFM